jgi:hypothetical protein
MCGAGWRNSVYDMTASVTAGTTHTEQTGQFINMQNMKALDVTGGKDAEGQAVIVWGNHGKINQQWAVTYVDKAEAVQTKGLNTDVGFEWNRPFYLRSRLPMKRVAECHGANNVWLRKWRKNDTGQQFFFDCTSKTIRSQKWKNYAMEIQSNGGSKNLRFTSGITSRWW